VQGDDLDPLLSRRGETLVALQYITRLILSKQFGHSLDLVVDVQGHKQRREEQLRRMARRMAEQAAERQRVMTLEPMPANERRLIHLELRDHPDGITESCVEGTHRKVTIIPRQKTAGSEHIVRARRTLRHRPQPAAGDMADSAIDYLTIGHLAKDLTPAGPQLGGTVSFASLTARALGYTPGILTAFGDGLDLSPLAGIPVVRVPSTESATFENIYGPNGRTQFKRAEASPLPLSAVPPAWRGARIVHLAP